MIQVNAYLTFDGNCREAMAFYKSCFGGKLSLTIVEDSPMAKQWSAHVQRNVLHAELRKDGLLLLGSDMAPAGGIVKGNAISLAFQCGNAGEMETYFMKLSAGGKVTHPLHRFHDGMIGALTDKFGMNWIFKL